MSLLIGTRTLVSDSVSNDLYGECKAIPGHPDVESYERSFPGASGVFDVIAGTRARYIRVECTWHTTDDEAVDQAIDEAVNDFRYQTLSFPDASGNQRTYSYCRLVGASPVGVRETGMLDDTTAMVVRKTLTFKQVRTAN